MLIKITCIECGAEGSMSLSDAGYKGPYKCWKCREMFAIEIADNELKSIGPFDQAEQDRIQAERDREKEIQALRDKFGKK